MAIFRGRSIRTPLAILTVLIAIMPVVVSQTITNASFRHDAELSSSLQLETIGELKSSQIETWVGSASFVLNDIAADTNTYQAIQDMLNNGDTSLSPQITDSLKRRVSAQGNTLLTQEEQIETIAVYSLQGKVLATTDPASAAVNVSTQPYWAAALQQERMNLAFLDQDKRGSKLRIIATLRIVDDNFKAVGVLAAFLNPNGLTRIVEQRNGLTAETETYLVVHTARGWINLSPLYLLGSDLGQVLPDSPLLENVTGGRSANGITTDYTNRSAIVYARPLSILGTILVSTQPQAAALATYNTTLQVILGLVALTIIIAIVLSVVASTAIIHPLVTLTKTAEDIASQDKPNPTLLQTTDRPDEIGRLQKSFNQMVLHLLSALNDSEQAMDVMAIATDQAHEANRAKSEFLSTISHELRSPLNVIAGQAGLWQERIGSYLKEIAEPGDEPPEVPAFEDLVEPLESILRSSDRLQILVNDLLDIGRIESGKTEINVTRIEIGEMVRSVIANTLPGKRTGVHFEETVSPDMPAWVIGDQPKLERIIINLLSNAFKFTHTGQVALRIQALHDKHVWEIEVSDSGIGIPEKAQKYVFEKFRQVDGSTQRAYGGTGLGLAIVQSLVLAMNGTVVLSSQSGQGSKFTITLPLLTDTPPASDTQTGRAA